MLNNVVGAPPVVLQDVISSSDLTRAIIGRDASADAVAAFATSVGDHAVLGRTLRRFLVPPHQRVMKLMYQAGEQLPEGVEYLVDMALARVCTALDLPEQPVGARARLRLRFMKGALGKQFHRNRWPSVNAVVVLEGAQQWHFLPSVPGVDAVFDAFDDPSKYCGYRSHRFTTDLPTPELTEQLSTMLVEAGEPSRIETMQVKAGDVLVFDGNWWHATRHLTDEVTHLCIALNGDEINNRDCVMKKATRALFRPEGKYTALLWPAKDTKTRT